MERQQKEREYGRESHRSKAALTAAPPIAIPIAARMVAGGRTDSGAGSALHTLEPVSLGDDLLHDLVRPGADPRQAGVAPRALDRKLAHVAVAADDLDCLISHLTRDPRREQLRLRHLAHRVSAFIPLLRAL